MNLVTNKEIAIKILAKLKEEQPILYERVRVKDIERLLNYFGDNIRAYLIDGGFITLTTTRTRLKSLYFIRFLPKRKEIISNTIRKIVNVTDRTRKRREKLL